jgi:outer membrane protein TolC
MTALLLTCALSAHARPITLTESIDLAIKHSLQLKQAEAFRHSSTEQHDAAKAERYPTVGVDGSVLYKSDVSRLDLSIPGIFEMNREIGSKENYQLDITASLPLYTGGRISSAISAARSYADLQTAMARASSEQVVLETRLAYFTLFGAQSLREAAQASLTRVQIASRSIYSLFEAGAADSTDLLESGLALNEATFALKQAVINRRSAEIRLLVLLGL